jgi:hypothetical protein
MVTVAEPDLDLSVTEVAVTDTVRLLAGGEAGAVNVTTSPLAEVVGETEPQGAAGQVTVQVMPALAASEATVALSCSVAFTCTVAAAGATETEMAATVTVADADFVESAAAVAVMLTVRLFAGVLAGAV